MPKPDHEMPIELIRNRPIVAVELLRDAAGVQPPPFATAAVEAVGLTQVPLWNTAPIRSWCCARRRARPSRG